MGALRNEVEQSSPNAAELHTRREICVLEDLRNAAQGVRLSAGPIIDHVEDLASRGEVERGLDLMEVAASYRLSFSRDDFDALRLAKAGMQCARRPAPRAAVEDLESLFNDEQALVAHRIEALVRLAQISMVAGDYRAAAAVLIPQQADSMREIYWAPAVVVARATYYNLAGDFSSALQDTDILLKEPSAVTPGQVSQVHIQHAWALTQLGRFAESRKFIRNEAYSQFGNSNALIYIDAWNEVGDKNISLTEALKGSVFALGSHPEESDGSRSFFRAWSALAENNVDQALEIFTTLPTGPEIEPSLNGTLGELALLGKAHTLLEMGDYEAAHDAFRRLSNALPDRPVGARLQIIMAAHSYGLLSARLNSLSAIEKVPAARRCAQISLGLTSPLIPRLMDIEAELLLANGRSAEARASRVIAIELIDKGVASTAEERLSHELGLHLVDAYEYKNNEALSGLRTTIPKMERELGPHHEKTIVARYALTSLADPNGPAGTDQTTAFEDLYEDLAKTFGATHLLSLKARYGLALRLSLRGQAPEALAHYKSIEFLLPDLPHNLKFKTSIRRRIGDSHRSLSQYEAAHTAYSSALESLQASLSPSKDRQLEIQLDIHESLVKLGRYRQAFKFFSNAASMLRSTNSETTTKYFRAVHGYACCLELMHNHAGSAHNYGHLVRLMNEGMHPKGLAYSARVYAAAAWNNEMSKNYSVATSLYEKALGVMKEAHTLDPDDRRVADLEHRLLCCSARLAA